MAAKLYAMSISHPSRAARLMLEHKGIEYDAVNVSPGMQAVQVRIAGFRGGTVPALSLGGRRIAGSVAISRALEEIQPDPPLFPRDSAQRRAVEDAEEWGERVLQPIPRRLLRWALRHDRDARLDFARRAGNARPELAAHAIGLGAVLYARREDAKRTERIRADWQSLPSHLDRVDELIAAGTIGGDELNAADFQIGTTLSVMLASVDYGPLVAGRPAEALARRVWPDFPYELPSLIPADFPRLQAA
ncbi:MAG TPA: glutathione S-transferase [Thermoleophilaceae bacterium]